MSVCTHLACSNHQAIALGALRSGKRIKLSIVNQINMETSKLLLASVACSLSLALPAQAINTVEETPSNAVVAEQHSPDKPTLMASMLWGD